MVKVHQDFEGIHYFGKMGLDPLIRRQHRDHPAYELAERFADEMGREGVRSGLRHVAARALRADGPRGVRPQPAQPSHWRPPAESTLR